MTEIYDQVLDSQEIQILLDWFSANDNLVDDRMDVRSKKPDWNSTSWPQYLVKKVLNHVLDKQYRVEVVLFYGSRISFRLHADSGNGDGQQLYKNVLIPLYVEGPATTVVFDNYWHGPHTRFGKISVSPFAYNLPGKNGNLEFVEDVRVLLEQCRTTPDLVDKFLVNDKFTSALEKIVDLRSGIGAHTPDGYVTDYSPIKNYKPNLKFDPDLHKQYLNHLPIENLHGLSIERIVEWKPGQVVTFDRNQLHCAGSGHQFKVGISIFTYKV
jgi:hypothetical protein